MAVSDILYAIALIGGAAWFGMGFRYFGFQQHTAAKVLIPREARDTPLFETTAAGIRFLGGFNAAFFLLCLVLLGAFFIFLLFQQFPSASNHALHCFRTLTRGWRPFQWLQLMSSNRCRVRTDERWLRRYQVDTNYDSRDADHLLFSWTGSPAEMTFCASLQMRYHRRSRRPWVGVRSPSEATLWQAPRPDNAST